MGLKPTVGRTSSSGIIPESRNLDVVGPIAKTVADAAVVTSAIVGHSLVEGPGKTHTIYPPTAPDTPTLRPF